MHPRAPDIIRQRIADRFADLQPPAEDPDELARSAAEIDVDPDTLRAWRDDYQSWTTADEWRDQMVDGLASDVLNAARQPGPRNWRRWTLAHKALSWGYVLGALSGTGTQYDWAGRQVVRPHLAGTRNKYTGRRNTPVYVLGWPVRKWRCLLRYRHWPTNDLIAFGHCSKCMPCPMCGAAAPLEHDCGDAA